ncbi:hypothetical protein FDP25_00985 [Roseovarius sp. A21]|uniref:Sulfotransferase family protein n=1 Tax=Roseovarius bejariae TaxID=2576383 RepID=A0A844CYT2_9RHOB|nr:hypothetical protein [Roseovarius bejariae]MRU13998.1 hypothetical protein [Roseovarius bejariae]
MQYIYHLGVHKTASSLLQRNLVENLDELRAQGVYYVNAEFPWAIKRQRNIIRQLHAPDGTSPGLPRRLNRRIANAAEQAGARIVLQSDSASIGPAMHEALANGVAHPGFYPQAEQCLHTLTVDRPPEDVRVLLYSRTPETYLTSLYSEMIREGWSNVDIDTFCQTLDLASLDFDTLKTRIEGMRPEFHVVMRQYERIKLGADTFISTFMRDIGLDAKYIQPVLPPHQPDLDAAQAEALRHVSFGDTSRNPRHVKRLRNRILKQAPNPADPLALPDWVHEALHAPAAPGYRAHAAS